MEGFGIKCLEKRSKPLALSVYEVCSLLAGKIRWNQRARIGQVSCLFASRGRIAVGGLLQCLSNETEDVACSSRCKTISCTRHRKTIEELRGVADIATRRWCRSLRLQAKDLHPHILNGSLDSVHARCFPSSVCITYQAIDLPLVLLQERMNVFFVDEYASLLAWQNQVQVNAEADPAIEWDPAEYEVELILDGEKEGEGGPVHEPWC